MTDERYSELSVDMNTELTKEEIEEGWFWCNDCDGLLVNEGTHPCPCLDNGQFEKLKNIEVWT